MALQYSFKLVDDGITYFNYSSPSRTPTGTGIWLQTETVGPGESVINIPSTIASGQKHECVLENKSTTNYLRIGFSAGVYSLRLRPRELQILQLEPTIATLFAVAQAANTDLLIYMKEE